MALYESVFIFRQDVPVTEVNNITATLTKIITEHEGKVLKKEYWGLRDLAYLINKNKKGHYVMLVSDAPHRAIAELNRKTKLSEDIIRTLSLRIESLDKKDSMMLTSEKDGYNEE
jgi:small subunit ribosomal protein S6